MTATATCVWVILLPIVLLSWVWALPCVFRRWDGWGLGGMVVELRTDGGQGGMRRGVCASTCWSAGPWWGKRRHGGMYTHTHTHLDTCASAFSKTLKASSCPEGCYHWHEKRSCSPMWQSMWKCCQLASNSEGISPSAGVSVDSTV